MGAALAKVVMNVAKKKLIERAASKGLMGPDGLSFKPSEVIASRLDKKLQEHHLGGVLDDTNAGDFIRENSNFKKTPQQVAAIQGGDLYKSKGEISKKEIRKNIDNLDPREQELLMQFLLDGLKIGKVPMSKNMTIIEAE